MIGAGGIAERHLRTLAAEPGIEIVGHVSQSHVTAERNARRWGGRAYRTCEELLGSEAVDAAWITVPPMAHGELELCFIEHGVPFLVEKPLAADRETPSRIAETLEQQNLLAAVGYHWRALDVLQEVRDVIAANPPRMVLAAWHDATPPPAWWRHQQESGGQMVEQATHLFDLARHLVGEARVLEATAKRHDRPAYPDADVADVSAAMLQFEAGPVGVFTATCLLGGPAAVHVQLVCEGLLVTITQQSVTFATARERREVWVSSDPIARENRAFIQALRTGDPSLIYSSYQDALRTHHLTLAVLEASDRNTT
jgi:myo-inositol 2-dehydrogenase/D-chiro-inositol 1-dehydrogenase